jgi:hypothetical protein
MDINTLAKSIVDQAIGDKQPKAVDPSRSKRGQRRAALLTPERRTEISKSAAAKRWGNKS